MPDRIIQCNILSFPQKTVVAILDSLINPDWPMLPSDYEEMYEKEWHRIPDIPLRYHFFYRILDGDNFGRAPSHDGFNHRSISCLHAICESDHNKVISFRLTLTRY